MHRRYIADALAMRCDPSTPSTRTPSRRPLFDPRGGRRSWPFSVDGLREGVAAVRGPSGRVGMAPPLNFGTPLPRSVAA
eukprot:1532756-Pyramimonas_sp.AAC.1